MKYFLTVVLCLFFCDLPAQSPKPTQPQNGLSSNDLLDHNIQELIDLCEQVRFHDPDSLNLVASRIYEIGTEKHQPVVQAWGEEYLGIYNAMTGKTEEALRLAWKNIKLLEKEKNQQLLMGKLYSLGGISLMKLNRQREALDMFYSCMRIAENMKDWTAQVKATNNIGWAFME